MRRTESADLSNNIPPALKLAGHACQGQIEADKPIDEPKEQPEPFRLPSKDHRSTSASTILAAMLIGGQTAVPRAMPVAKRP